MLHHGYLCKVCGTVSPRDFPWPALLHKKGKETVRNPTERTESRTEGAITAVEQSRASQSVRRSARTCTGRSPVHPAARFRSMLPCGQAPTVLCRWRAGFYARACCDGCVSPSLEAQWFALKSWLRNTGAAHRHGLRLVDVDEWKQASPARHCGLTLKYPAWSWMASDAVVHQLHDSNQSINLDGIWRAPGVREHPELFFLILGYGQEPVGHRLPVLLPRPYNRVSLLDVILRLQVYQVIGRTLESCRS